MAIESFKGTLPEFLPEGFFDGRLEGWAVMESLTGGLQKRATIAAEGSWDAQTQTVTFTETYSFDDGHKDTLRWAIEKIAAGKYTGTEPRLVGEAEGEQAGCAYHWQYSRDTPQADGSSSKLNFDDWFYRIDERAGLPFATAHVTYRKISQA